MGIPDADLRNVMAELFRVYFCLATIRVSQHFSSSTDSDGELLGGKCCTALLDALHVHQGESSSDGSLLRPHLDAHRLIEEFMILANVAAAERGPLSEELRTAVEERLDAASQT